VETDDVVEEGPCHGDHRVWMSKGDQVGIFGETVDDGEDGRFPPCARKAFDKIHGDVRPN
jgi:hypothetical protein